MITVSQFPEWRESRERGAVPVRVAKEHLTALLGTELPSEMRICSSDGDAKARAIVVWAVERSGALAARRTLGAVSRRSPKRREALRELHGAVNPEARPASLLRLARAARKARADGRTTRMPAVYLEPPAERGRPSCAREDRANAELLRVFPELASEPIALAMLEGLYDLDVDEAIRFPSPDEWMKDPESARDRFGCVRARSARRLRRARRLVKGRRR